MAPKGKPLTIAMLGLSSKGKGMPDGEESEDDMGDSEGEGEDEKGLPPGFLEASTEMRDAEDDESFAKAFHNALKCAGAC